VTADVIAVPAAAGAPVPVCGLVVAVVVVGVLAQAQSRVLRTVTVM
jgi:hypothetical protein